MLESHASGYNASIHYLSSGYLHGRSDPESVEWAALIFFYLNKSFSLLSPRSKKLTKFRRRIPTTKREFLIVGLVCSTNNTTCESLTQKEMIVVRLTPGGPESTSQRRRAPVPGSRGYLHGVQEFLNSTEARTLDVTNRNLYTRSPGSGMITNSKQSETRFLRAVEESGCLIAFWIGDTCLSIIVGSGSSPRSDFPGGTLRSSAGCSDIPAVSSLNVVMQHIIRISSVVVDDGLFNLDPREIIRVGIKVYPLFII